MCKMHYIFILFYMTFYLWVMESQIYFHIGTKCMVLWCVTSNTNDWRRDLLSFHHDLHTTQMSKGITQVGVALFPSFKPIFLSFHLSFYIHAIFLEISSLQRCRVFTYIHSLLIEKDGCDRQNTSIKFPFACPSVISSIFSKSFHFPFPYLVLFVLRYFSFHVVYLHIII